MGIRKKVALILAFWVGLSGNWFASSAWAQSAELEEAKRLNDHLMHLFRQGKYAEAVPFAQKALNNYEQALGPEHPYVGRSLNNLALLYKNMGNYAAAEPLYKRSLKIREKALGTEHPDVATSLNNLAMLYRAMGNYAAAEPLCKRSLAIREKALGPEHPDVATSLNNLAMLYRAMGNYAAAEPLCKRSLAIREKELDPEHLDVAQSLNNLAGLYDVTGNYAAAEPLYKRSIAVLEKSLGPDHPDVANGLNNLASLYQNMKNYAAAESFYKRSLATWEKALGSEHPDVATSLNNIADLYKAMGNYAAAEPLYKHSLAIKEKALGREHPDVATGLSNLADLYHVMGNLSMAEPLYNRSLAIREKILGAKHPDAIKTKNILASINMSAQKSALPDHEENDRLENQVIQYYRQGKYPEAIQIAQEELNLREKALGLEHPDVAVFLNYLGLLYTETGKYDEAESLLERSLRIREKIVGPEHLQVAESLNNLALLYSAKGNYAEAHRLYKRSFAIVEKALGPEHPDVATSLNNLAALYRDMGNYAAAEPLYTRSLGIREKALGPDHSDLAISLNNLAALYRDMANYAAAEALNKRTLAITEKALGPEHPNVATSLNNLAELYHAMGKYAAAEPLSKRSLAIREKVLGPEHPNVATSLNNLAALYRDMGNYAAAEPLNKRALGIIEKVLGPEHPNVATSLNSLAALYFEMGNYAPAESLLKRSLGIREKNLGPEHLQVAESLNNLATLYFEIGNHTGAESLLKRSLELREKKLGPEHPAVANTLNAIAVLYYSSRRYSLAEPLFKRSLAITEKMIGPEHFNISNILQNISILYVAQGKNIQGLGLMTRAQGIEEGMLEQIAGFTSGERTMQFLATTQGNIDVCLSLVSSLTKEDIAARKEAFGVWLRRKGVVLEAQRRMQQALLETGDREAAKLFEELSQTRTRLAELTFAGPGKEKSEAYQKRLKDLNAQREEFESKLSRLSQAYVQARKVRKVTVEEVVKALPQETVLVDFARINVFDFNAKGNEKKWLPARYLAFVLQPGQGQDVALLDLGAADEIDATLNQFKNAVTQEQDAKARDLGRKLHDLIFLPLQKELRGAQRVFLSPDGALNLLPFEILRDPEGRYLIEKYTFNYLAAGRDLVGFSEKKASKEKAVLLGDPDFDLDPNQKNHVLDRMGMRADTAVAAVRSVEKLSLPFERLKETGEEVNAIGDLLGRGQCEVFLESSALEEVLQSRRAPRILHLATHGFFLEDQERLAIGGIRGIGGTVSFMSMEQPFARPLGPKVNLENPLLRSGIALAGANRAGSSGQGSDGILTADEVLGLRLRGTELVVLSACETGLGEVKTGEGVFGLRRAFAQAGARSMVMSMWSVPDRETQELMVEFYKNILSGKLDRCQALRQAALTQKKVVQQRYGQDNPFFWGAFVFLGQAD